jgi:SAM-dependent methyltransferase
MFSEMERRTVGFPEQLGALRRTGGSGGAQDSVFRERQGEFFDENPPLYPWPDILRRQGLGLVCKPREALWREGLEGLNLRPGDRLLDIGCGIGIWLDRLGAQFGVDGFGIDVSTASLQTAMAESVRPSSLACAEGGRLPFASESFEAVICVDVLEHIPQQSQAIGEMARILKEGGSLFLWSINSQQRMTWNWCLDKLGVDVFDRVAHDPRLLPDVPSVEKLLVSSGMSVGTPILFDSFFALALDEAIMVAASACERLGLYGKGNRFGETLGRIFLAVANALSTRLLGPLMWLDRSWTRKGLSNGFLFVARKPYDAEREEE